MRLGIAELFVNTNDSESKIGEVAERLNASVSKTEIPARVSGVQIPPSPFKNLTCCLFECPIISPLKGSLQL